jgi:hypothetical protein
VRPKNIALVFLAALVMTGCGGSAIRNARMLWDLTPGMSEAEIRDSMGRPIKVRPAEMLALQADHKYKVYLLVPSEPDCPETAVGNAMLSFITLGASAAAQDRKSAKRYRLYFTRGRYIRACPIETHPKACRRLEEWLVKKIIRRIKRKYHARAGAVAKRLIPVTATQRLTGVASLAPAAYPLILSAPPGSLLPARLAGFKNRRDVTYVKMGVPKRLSHPELFKPKKKKWTQAAYRDYYYNRYLPQLFSQ